MRVIIAAASLLALVACQRDDPNNFAIDESNSLNADIEILPPDEGNDQTAEANATEQPGALMIPAAFHGRWGMVAADCTSTRGDAKGLISVDASTIQFFESRARLTKVTLDAPDNFTGTFAFTGEGQNWTNSQNLKLSGNSSTLVRTQSDVVRPFTYKRCA